MFMFIITVLLLYDYFIMGELRQIIRFQHEDMLLSLSTHILDKEETRLDILCIVLQKCNVFRSSSKVPKLADS